MQKLPEVFSTSQLDQRSTQETVAKVVKELVLDKLKYHYWHEGECFDVEVKWFDNCREYGYMYRILNAVQDITFSVYVHRNSDQIIINADYTQKAKPHGVYNKGTKWDYLKAFDYNQHYDVAGTLAEWLLETKEGTFNTSLFN